MKLEKFVDQLRQTYGDNLESVVLFGSAVEQSPPPKRDVDLMLVFASLQLNQLTAGARLINRWMRQGNPEPLLIDRKHIAESLDVFPIEFADMQDRHRVLWGDDPLDGIRIETPALRLQCEREIKQKILLLRQYSIAHIPRPRAGRRLLLESVGSIMAIIRGTLRVLGEPVPQGPEDQVRQIADRSELDLSAISEILTACRGGGRISGGHVMPLMERYLTSLEELATYIDRL